MTDNFWTYTKNFFGFRADRNCSIAGPGEVASDQCLGRKRKASKSCPTCLASYCETHIQLHLGDPILKRHRLEAPISNLQERTCLSHRKPLKLFCRTDQKCICEKCGNTKHRRHELVDLETEITEKKYQVVTTQREYKRRVEERKKKVKKMKQTVQQLRSSAENEIFACEEIFRSIIQSTERLKSEVTELIRDHEQREANKANESIKTLDKEMKELEQRDTEITKLSNTDNPIQLLQNFPTVCVPPTDSHMPNVNINVELFSKTLQKDLLNLKRSLRKINVWKFVKPKGYDDPVDILQNMCTRNFLLKYSCQLTFNPNTLNEHLHLSEGYKRVTFGNKIQYPKHPDRFNYWSQVLCREALSGTRLYWEVQWSGEIEIGVVKEISRRGNGNDCRLGRNVKSWCLRCSASRYSAWHDNKETPLTAPGCDRVGVYLDCPAGLLSFFSVSDTITRLYTFKASFMEPLYVGFWLGFESSVMILKE
ncbi:tripartite motif-containing protein 16-like [Erpetoichthys calabaricus]|uniref:tripartite motif-containing protein 16-like n=1 Tax=Erpetoichthys calabaricus TaxID=27687 RepID=UPI0022346276|nr:tripartite motif-containing protein 16-like [Erpetoichthys calabaricus]